MPRRKLPPTDPESASLTPAEQQFLEAYLVDRNGTRSYLATHPKTTYGTAAVQAHRLLKKPNIRAEIAAARRAQSIRTQISADRVLNELAQVAFSDILDLFDDQGQLRSPRQISMYARRAILSVKMSQVRRTVTRNGKTRTTVTEKVIEYKFLNKLEALGKLADHLGLATPITPLESLLAALPLSLSAQLRVALTSRPGRNGTGSCLSILGCLI